ncbi:MAG TPA: sulfotransferase [bacterium]|nr:sulfotransferase [bacterium]
MRRLPGFVGVGAQKAGTTSLHAILSRHPQVFLPAAKETKFFSHDELYRRGPSFYASFFADAGAATAAGEIDPDCLHHPEIARRLLDTLGKELRVIVMLRHPADRAYSQYLMSRYRGLENEPFERALEREPDRRRRGAFEAEHFSYVERGRYLAPVRRLRAAFERIAFVRFERDFLGDRERTVRGLLEFLGVDAAVPLDLAAHRLPAAEARFPAVQRMFHRPSRARNVVRGAVGSPAWKTRLRLAVERWNRRDPRRPRLDPDVRARVFRRYFADEIDELEALVNASLDDWRPSSTDR